jgi:signal transduction histidine kinase/CheY-like chemotaxis protein
MSADATVRLYVLVFGSVALLYALPILSREQLQSFGQLHFDLTFVPIVLLALTRHLRTIPDREERVFWYLLVVAAGFWLLVLVFFAAVPDRLWGMGWTVATDCLYLGYYLSFLLAVERRPHRAGVSEVLNAERWLKSLGTTALASGLLVYFVVVPAAFNQTFYSTSLPSFHLFLALDTLIIVRLLWVLGSCDSRRWRVIYGALLAQAALLGLCDLLEWLTYTNVLPWQSGRATDLVWALPTLAFVVAARLRHQHLPGKAPARAHGATEGEGEFGQVGIFLVVAGFSFVAIHYVLYAVGLLDLTTKPAREIVVAASLMVIVVLAVVAYRTLERQRDAMKRRHQKLEAQLQQAQKMEAIGRLAGGLAHDFNNLLTAIRGYSELASMDLPPRHPSRGNLDEVFKASDRAAALTRQLLAFSRRQILKPEVLDLNGIVSEIDKMLRRLIGEDIGLVTVLAPGLGRVRADRALLGQVLLNLAVNARDAMPEGGTLAVETANMDLDAAAARNHPGVQPGPYIVLSVSDTGTGMPPEVQEHIFEPFFTTKEPDKGTGLGLSMVYGIVSQSGGSIEVASEPDQGTTFRIFLPRVDESAQSATERASSGRVPAGVETILLVEDESTVRSFARIVLERCGYRVLEAGSGPEALALAARHPTAIDLLLTDVVMPEMNGRVLAERLADLRPNLRVLYMSGHTGTALIAPNNGSQLVQKPFSHGVLAAKVREVLDAPALAAVG